MPELPEVETTRRGIEPWVLGRRVETVEIRNSQLRWPVPPNMADLMVGSTVEYLRRRGKYLLFTTSDGTALVHLGMSGSLRVSDAVEPWRKHDHWSWRLDSGRELRYHDPRRFGALLWLVGPAEEHSLLASLGPEPLSAEFDNRWLWRKSRGRSQAIKNFVMDSKVVVGVGNIYASEALFRAGIDPRRAAGNVSQARYALLSGQIRDVLGEAIESGGSTLRDYINGSGAPGYFQQKLSVYGREGLPCVSCASPIKNLRLGQRSSFYCSQCQR